MWFPLHTALASGVSLVHPYVDLRQSPKKLCWSAWNKCHLNMCSWPDSNVPTVWISDQVVPLLTTIVNQSLSTGIFPSCMRSAVAKPLLKKHSLDPNVLKNIRTVSNLSFVSKLIEKLVLDQLFRHLDHNNLWHTFQSAYRPKHSTCLLYTSDAADD